MAKEPMDRDDTKRPGPPGGDPNAAPRKDAPPRAKGDDKGNFLPDDSFLLDIGEAAPRVKATGGDDATEEWLLVDDDLVSAAGEAGGATAGARPSAKMPGDDLRRDAEASRLVNDMHDVGAELGLGQGAPPAHEPPADADVAARIADVEAQAIAPMDAPASEPPPAFDADAQEPPLADAPDEAPAPEPELKQAKKKAGPKSTRRPLARAAGILFLAALGGGGWYAWKNYWPKGDATDVAATPTADPGAAKPAPKPAKAAPKPDPAKPVDAKPDPKPAPAPTGPESAPKGDPSSSIPVVQANPPAPGPAGDPSAPSKDPFARAPAKQPNPTTVIIDPRQPIRPAKVMPGPANAKSTGPVKKTDTIVELKNGYTMRGRLKRVKDDQLTLGVTNGEFTFPLSEVKVLDGSAPEYMAAADMPNVSIVLNGGQRLRGRKMKEDAERVVLVVDQGQIVVYRRDIREVSTTGRIHF
jgi:hypothetical protein